MILTEFAGSWAGINGFRLMPADPLAELPATATVTTAAGGHLTAVAYTWVHPEDGPQDGLMLIGKTEDGLTATWGDSWHQKPEQRTLTATDDQTFECEYGGGWGWQITFDPTDQDTFRMRMHNVIPADQATDDIKAGPYPVMVLDAKRA